MALTQHDRLVAGLHTLGAITLPKRNKYTMLQLGTKYYFVSKAGTLRWSSRASAATSIRCGDRFRQKMLNAEVDRLLGAV